VPELDRPILVAALASVQTGSTGAAVLAALGEQLNAQPLAEIDADEFYDFTVVRPVVHFDEGGERAVEWPRNQFRLVRTGSRDLVLFSGIEPHLRWRSFGRAFDGWPRASAW
jgi:hypothetical protein